MERHCDTRAHKSKLAKLGQEELERLTMDAVHNKIRLANQKGGDSHSQF